MQYLVLAFALLVTGCGGGTTPEADATANPEKPAVAPPQEVTPVPPVVVSPTPSVAPVFEPAPAGSFRAPDGSVITSRSNVYVTTLGKIPTPPECMYLTMYSRVRSSTGVLPLGASVQTVSYRTASGKELPVLSRYYPPRVQVDRQGDATVSDQVCVARGSVRVGELIEVVHVVRLSDAATTELISPLGPAAIFSAGYPPAPGDVQPGPPDVSTFLFPATLPDSDSVQIAGADVKVAESYVTYNGQPKVVLPNMSTLDWCDFFYGGRLTADPIRTYQPAGVALYQKGRLVLVGGDKFAATQSGADTWMGARRCAHLGIDESKPLNVIFRLTHEGKTYLLRGPSVSFVITS